MTSTGPISTGLISTGPISTGPISTGLCFYNSLGRKLEPFEPLEGNKVHLYTCGPTVYNHVHIGNHRTFLFEDFLRRTLRFLGYEVVHVMNLTDIDDKTIRGAQEQGVSLIEYTQPYIESFFEDLDTLHVERAEHYPRATDHIGEMISLIETLLESGAAYESDGSVFFRIAADEDYGRLSGIDVTHARPGSRVAQDEYDKEDLRDFALWKSAKAGEPAWSSPWGDGRPGWHLECSAMGMKYLGETFDIHCGGVDNMFPHHENEIAQSESATGKTFVRTWLHSEHLMVDGEKMAKSLGNQYTLKDLAERKVNPRALRYLFLSSHYRQKLNFTWASLEAASGALRRADEMRFRLEHATEKGEPSAVISSAVVGLIEDFTKAVADDLNSAAALGAVFQCVRAVNKAIEQDQVGQGDRRRVTEALARVDQVLGVLDPADWSGDQAEGGGGTSEGEGGTSDEEIDRMIAQRQEARVQRDFATADRLRDALRELGIVIEDTPQGARWKRA